MGETRKTRLLELALTGLIATAASAWGQTTADPPKAKAAEQEKSGDKDKPKESEKKPAPAEPKLKPEDFALPGENPPRAFVPKTPRTTEERKEIDAIRLYAVARSQEERRQFRDAIATLEEALKADPNSLAVLRRLSLLTGALGQIDRSIEYARKVLKEEPGDSAVVSRLVEFYRGRRRDPGKAEALLKEVLANPKLDKKSAGYILTEFELSRLYADTRRFDQAAISLEKVIDALDDKSSLKLSPAEQRRILGVDEADAYENFGLIFLASKRYELAIRAFQRGLVYNPDHPAIPVFLAQAQLDAGHPEKALEFIETVIKRKPPGREAYDLLAEILGKLKRDKDIIPRFEEAVKVDPKNVALQYSLADKYRAAGMTKQADELVNKLIDVQPDLQGFSGLFTGLLKQKKSEELLRLLEKVTTRLRREDAVRPQIEAIVADPAYAEQVLDTGLKMLESKPPKLDRTGWLLLIRIATVANKPGKLVDLLKWSVKQAPDPIAYRELAIQLAQLGRNDEAEKTVVELFEKYPPEKNAANLLLLGRLRLRAGKEAAAIESLREALKLDPRFTDATRTMAFLLNQQGKTDEAVTVLRDALKGTPTDPELNASLAGVLTAAGRSQEAISFWKSVLEKYPNNDELVRVGRSSLSTIYTGLGDYAKGEAELELLLAKYGDDPGVNNDLGYLYAEQGKNLEKAEAMIRKAVDQNGENSAYLDSLGWVLFKRGKVKEAATWLEKAVKFLETDDATIHDHLGDVYFEMKERDKAKASWEKAEKIAASAKPPDKKLSEIRKKLEALKTLKGGSGDGQGKNP